MPLRIRLRLTRHVAAARRRQPMDRYPNISDHGLIGDLQTAALVSTDGTVDWFCCPRFDSPSVFASLLDADKGGYFRVAPDASDCVTKQLYLPDTAVLITRFMTEAGVGEVTDFMPIAGATSTDRHRLVRMLRVVRGSMRFVVDIKPRFDYGRLPHKVEISDNGVVFDAGGIHLTLHPVGERTVPLEDQGLGVEQVDEDIRLTRTLHEGETTGLVLESMGGRPSRGAAGRAGAPDRRHRALLAGLAAALLLHRPLAGNGRPVSHDPQADDLCANRRPGGRAHRRAARADRRGAQLGLPLHLDQGRLLLRLRPAWARVPGRGRGVRVLGQGPADRAWRRRPAAAEDHVPGRRDLRPHRDDTGPLRGLARVAAGPDRQRRRRPGPARHLRRGARRHVQRATPRACSRPTWAGPRWPT